MSLNLYDYPGTPYSRCSWINNQPVFTLSEGLFGSLDQFREFAKTDEYYFQGVGFPNSSQILLGARQTFSANISVPPLSFLLAITGASTDEAGFQLRIYDKGGKMDSFINTQFIFGSLAAPEISRVGLDPATEVLTPYIAQSPTVITRPGSLQMEITNLATASAYCQVMLHLAVPLNPKSVNSVVINQPS